MLKHVFHVCFSIYENRSRKRSKVFKCRLKSVHGVNTFLLLFAQIPLLVNYQNLLK
jgi:hypothetical protein